MVSAQGAFCKGEHEFPAAFLLVFQHAGDGISVNVTKLDVTGVNEDFVCRRSCDRSQDFLACHPSRKPSQPDGRRGHPHPVLMPTSARAYPVTSSVSNRSDSAQHPHSTARRRPRPRMECGAWGACRGTDQLPHASVVCRVAAKPSTYFRRSLSR